MTDTASAAPSDLDIDATWDALPGIRIHNDANARGLDTQTMLRRAFARAVLAKWGQPTHSEPVVCGCGDKYPPQGWDAGFIAAIGRCANCQAALDCAKPTPLAVVEPRMPVGNATLERLREWERDGELLERVWGTLVDQETEIGQLRAAARAPTDSQPAAAVKPACWIPPEREGEYHRPGEAITASREPMAGWEPVYRAARAPADSVTAPAGGVDDAVDAIALARYKVVTAHESMFHRFAVVAGDGKQQLYLGREVECENMARKFAGAFLDGAFYQSNIAPTPPARTADSVLEDAARLDFLIEQRAYVVSDPDACPGYWLHFVHKETGECWVQGDEHPTPRAAIDAARKQGANHD